MRASYYAEGCYSSRGQNRSPYNLAHHPGGSSSGNASSLASNMCAFSIGTETDGSIMFAADRNAVVGLKPTVGLMSTVGVIPESPSMDTVGSFSRSVEDAKIVLDIIHERRTITDAHVNRLASTPVHNFYPGPYTSWLSKKNVLKGARFGIPWKRVWERASQNVAKRLEYNSLMELIEKIEKAGALVVKVNFPSAEEIISTGGWDREFGDGKTGSRLSEFEVVRTKFYRSHTA